MEESFYELVSAIEWQRQSMIFSKKVQQSEQNENNIKQISIAIKYFNRILYNTIIVTLFYGQENIGNSI